MTTVLDRKSSRCWRRDKHQWILDRVPKPSGAAALGAAIVAHLLAVIAPGVPHQAAAAVGAVIGMSIQPLIPRTLTYINAAMVPILVHVDAGAGDAIGQLDKNYLPTVALIGGVAVAFWIAGRLYDKSSIRLAVPVIEFKQVGKKTKKTKKNTTERKP